MSSDMDLKRVSCQLEAKCEIGQAQQVGWWWWWWGRLVVGGAGLVVGGGGRLVVGERGWLAVAEIGCWWWGIGCCGGWGKVGWVVLEATQVTEAATRQ